MLLQAPVFITSVTIGAAITVYLATELGFPISTTHALIGGLVGAGLGSSSGQVNFEKLVQAFAVPMLLSPVLAASLGVIIYKLIGFRKRKTECACVVAGMPNDIRLSTNLAVSTAISLPTRLVSEDKRCDQAQSLVRVSGTKFL